MTESPTLAREHRHGGHARRLLITRVNHGWELREEFDQMLVRAARCADWHRVELSLHLFDLRAREFAESTSDAT